MLLAMGVAMLLQGTAPIAPPYDTAFFLETPSSGRMLRALPEHVRQALIRYPRNVDVTISCRVDAEGRLNECVVVSASPEWNGIDLWVQRVSKWFRLRPQTSSGPPIEGGVVKIPLHIGMLRH